MSKIRAWLCAIAVVVWLVVPAGGWAGEVALPERIYRDVEGNPLPFQTEEEAEAFLVEAEVTSHREIGTGVTSPWKLVLEKDGLKVHAAFNYVNERAEKQDLGDDTTELFFVDSYQADIAAYKLSRLLGVKMIPPGVERKVEDKVGVVRLWIEELESYREWLDAGGSGQPGSWYLHRQLKDQKTFDLLIRNLDRNATNINWDPDWNLWMIDQTRSMGRLPELDAKEKADFKGCSRDLFEAMKALDPKTVKRELGDYLSTFEIKALMKRRDKLIKLIEREGGEKILFNYSDPSPGIRVVSDHE